jgi:uncharacterized protein (DUF983 family)
LKVSVLKQPLAIAPLAMSAFALLFIIGHIVLVGTARQADEGLEAHLWQILMAAQMPFIALFALTSLPRAPRTAGIVLGVQIAAAIAAAAPVFLLRW